MSDKNPVDYLERLLGTLRGLKEVELQDVEFEVEELELFLQPLTRLHGRPFSAEKVKPSVGETVLLPRPAELAPAGYEPSRTRYQSSIAEVKLGATKTEGGTRGVSHTIGGQIAPPFYYFEGEMPHRPVVSFDVFDTKIPLAKPVKAYYEEVVGDPSAWAKLCVDKFGADMITIHLVSTDPMLGSTTPAQAARTVEDILQAVDVPLAVGAAGVPGKDVEVLVKVAEVAEGERLLLNSANLDMDYAAIANAAKKHGHIVLSWTQLDINNQKKLNRELLDILPPAQIVIDPTTGALGYGIEYTFSIMERIRLAGLMGDTDLQMPIASGTTNAWAAREAWINNPDWGPREIRGPLWETVTGITALMAGCDFYMMMHPGAVQTFKKLIGLLTSASARSGDPPVEWISMRI